MTQTWICDTCGQSINRPEDGYVERLSVPTSSPLCLVREMRLVHKNGKCQFNEREPSQKGKVSLADRSLKDYTGPDGLMGLLEHAADPAFRDIDVAEMIKRIQIPGYDIAKGHFKEAIGEGVIEPNQAAGFYSQREIKAVIEHYEL